MPSLVTCSVGGVALVLTFIVTILDGLCFAASNNSALESATVSLSTLACVALVGLLVLRQKHPETKIWPWNTWHSAVHGFLIGYLFITAGVTAGTIARSLLEAYPKPRFIARNIIWAFSVFIQAIFSGLLLVPEGSRPNDTENQVPRWPGPRPHEMEVLPHRSRERNEETRQAPPESTHTLVETFRPQLTLNTKTSNEGLAPWTRSNAPTRVSSRYSGRTLYQNESTRNSVDLHPGTGSLAKHDPQDACTISEKDQQQQQSTDDDSQESRRDSDVKLSMDSLLILPSPGIPSPVEFSPSTTTSSLVLDPLPTAVVPSKPQRQQPPPTLNLPPNGDDQLNIHPLFRTCSPSPPPTPLPGTNVKASPAAGQTISPQTLNRVRSTTSLRVKNNGRSRSPLFGQMDLAEEESSGEAESSAAAAAAAISRPMPGIIMAGEMGKV